MYLCRKGKTKNGETISATKQTRDLIKALRTQLE